MNSLYIKTIIAALCILLYSCEKEDEETLVEINIETTEVSNVEISSAVVEAKILTNESLVDEKGFFISQSPNSQEGEKNVINSDIFEYQFSNLKANTTYYTRSFIYYNNNRFLGNELNFKTKEFSKGIVTREVSSVASHEAQINCEILNEYIESIDERGICWSTSPNPTVEDSVLINGSGVGEYVCNLVDLTSNMTYYCRAFISMSSDVKYGNQISFSTAKGVGVVKTSSISTIGFYNATGGGVLIDNGGESFTKYGLCWNTFPNPLVENSHTTDNADNGIFISTIENLTPGETYFVRAYATNSYGTAYGEDVTFKTLDGTVVFDELEINGIYTSAVYSEFKTTFNGGAEISETGICYSTNPNPTIDNKFTSFDKVSSEDYDWYRCLVSDLKMNTKYYIRAYAINEIKVSYSDEISFTTSDNSGGYSGAVVDFDQNIYKTVKIGNQWWMAENLRCKHDIDGNWVGYVEYSGGATGGGVVNTGAYYPYRSINKVCPTGWHLPSDSNWLTLIQYIGANNGGVIKQSGTNNWKSPNTGATNSTGFEALPGGFIRNYVYEFYESCYFWSEDTYNLIHLSYDSGSISTVRSSLLMQSYDSGELKLNIRCVKD